MQGSDQHLQLAAKGFSAVTNFTVSIDATLRDSVVDVDVDRWAVRVAANLADCEIISALWVAIAKLMGGVDILPVAMPTNVVPLQRPGLQP